MRSSASLALLSLAVSASLISDCTVERTVFVPTEGVSIVDFDLDPATAERLRAAGDTAARQFLAGWDFAAHVRRCRRALVEITSDER